MTKCCNMYFFRCIDYTMTFTKASIITTILRNLLLFIDRHTYILDAFSLDMSIFSDIIIKGNFGCGSLTT